MIFIQSAHKVGLPFFPCFHSFVQSFPRLPLTSIVTSVATINSNQVRSLVCLPLDLDASLEFLVYSQPISNSANNHIILPPKRWGKTQHSTSSKKKPVAPQPKVMQLGLVMLNSSPAQVVHRPHIRLPRPAVTHFQLQTPPPDPPAEEGTMSTQGNVYHGFS